MNTCRYGALALMLAWLVGCAAPADEMIVSAERVNDLGYTYGWARDLALPSDERISDARVLGDLVVIVEQPGNMVTALSLRDGQRRWGRVVGRLNQPLYGAIRWDGLIHVNTPTRLHSLAVEDGSVSGITDLDATVADGPVLYEDFAIFGGVNGRVFAHNLNTGFYRWAYQMSGKVSTRPLLHNRRVFVTDDQGTYAMLRADDGSLLWRRYTWGPITARPAADPETIYLPSEDRSLYALELRAGGRDRWIHHAERPLSHTPGVTSQAVLLPRGSEGLLALDARDGRELWRLDAPAELVREREDGRLLLRTDTGLMLVHPETGEVLAEAPTQRLETVLLGPDQSIILVSQRGRLLRLNRLP